MQRTLTFHLISDSRFGEDETSHSELVNAMYDHLSNLPTIMPAFGPHKLYRFGDTYSWRTQFWVTKTRTLTWQQVKQAVNSIRACYYTFVQRSDRNNHLKHASPSS